jgi:hypothetical protein
VFNSKNNTSKQQMQLFKIRELVKVTAQQFSDKDQVSISINNHGLE